MFDYYTCSFSMPLCIYDCDASPTFYACDMFGREEVTDKVCQLFLDGELGTQYVYIFMATNGQYLGFSVDEVPVFCNLPEDATLVLCTYGGTPVVGFRKICGEIKLVELE